MEILLLIFVVLVQNLAIFFDNHAIFFLISNRNSSKVALAYTKKFQIDFLSRGFLFFTPPLLGLFLTHNNLYFLLLSLFISAFVTFLLTMLQSIYFLQKMKIQFLFPMTQKNILLLTLGLVVYSIYLYVPFYLNILSYYFKNQSLWIVQLSPALTAISTVFVVFYMDPKVAKFIDSSKGKKNSSVLFELIAIRMFGRFVILGSSAYLFFNLV